MTEKNQSKTSEHDLDRALDAALARYSAVEPRAGLEGRILANLRMQPVTPQRAWWGWSAAVALAMIVIVATVIAVRTGKTPSPVAVQHSPEQAPREIPTTTAKSVAPNVKGSHKGARRIAQAGVAAAIPRLDHFPSRQPLSTEELALARYVQDFPEEAVMIARIQQEDEIEMQKKMEEGR